MSAPPPCTLGHRSGVVRPEGLLHVKGHDYPRWRCQSPDGSFHRFVVPPGKAAAAVGAPIRTGDGTAFLPAVGGRPAARAQMRPGAPAPLARSLAPRPVPPLPHRRRPSPAVEVRAEDRTVVFDPAGFQAPVSAPAVVRSDAGVAAGRRRVLVLPSPPTDEEKHWYFGAQNRWFVWAGAGTGSLVLASLVTFAVHSLLTSLFLGVAVLRVVTTAVDVLISARRRRIDGLDHEARVLTWQPELLPSVDVFLPTAGEELDVLANTYLHVARLEWEGRLRVHVLDDAGRPEVADLAAGYGFTYHCRPDRGVMKKAGNLRYGLEHSTGDLIAVFDADFVPRPEYLYELVPYFEDAEVGIVQSPQFFDTGWRMNWLQRAAGATQEVFYRFIQPARDAADAAICVGTCAVYRRAALDAAGGFAQIEHSEDVHTGVDMLRAGFVVRYVQILLAKGLCPDTLSGFLNQQYRWCLGSMSLLTDRGFHRTRLTLRQRLCFWSGFFHYISTAVLVFTATLPTVVMLWLFPAAIDTDNYRLLAPALTLTYVVTPLVMRGTWRLEVLRVQMVESFASAVAIAHTLRRRAADWVPTGVEGSGTPVAVTIRRLMAVTVLGGQVLLWAGIARDLPTLGAGRLWPLIALALVTAYVQLPALLPLQQSRPDGAVRRPPYPSAAAPAERRDDVRAPGHAAEALSVY